ncbi:uncharacterized protein TRAVEDRAFT_123646, partial [Trametes versicolor FP-101664 SS1]|uniref:uncharacterized protein n=1 Tax=Trametes versicolor (strain FP-101664) TaxID=717944 RepID=UPI000462125E
KLTYQDCDVPPPPPLSFTMGIDHMNRIWDDADLHHPSPLTILGVPVPVFYWREIYRYGKGGPNGFWAKHSTEDRRHPLTTIVGDLRLARKASDEYASIAARETLGVRFDDVFTYRKGRDNHVYQKHSSIARMYRLMEAQKL